MSSFRSKIGALASGGGDAGQAQPETACQYCQAPTPTAVLSACGARCKACYSQYLRDGFSGAERPPQARQTRWVPIEAARCESERAARTAGTGGFAMAKLAQRLAAATARRVPAGLSDDEVNGLLQEVQK